MRSRTQRTPNPKRRLRGKPLEDRRLLAWGPEMVADLNQNGSGVSTLPLVALNDDRIMFIGETENQLWVSDGTPAASHAVAEISTGRWTPFGLNSRVVFAGAYAENHYQLWTTDGVADGTRRLGAFVVNESSGALGVLRNGVVWKDAFYFLGENTLTGEQGLWRTDGTEQGTAWLTEAPTWETGDSAFNGAFLGPIGGRLLYVAADRVVATDGTASGTTDASLTFPRAALWENVVLGDQVLFVDTVSQGSPQQGLWRTDGAPDGATLLMPFADNEFGSLLGLLDNQALFLVASVDDQGRPGKIWLGATDGSVAGTSAVRTLSDESDRNSFWISGDRSINSHGVGFFSSGGALWQTDGTEQGTRQVAPSQLALGNLTGLGVTFPGNLFAVARGALYFGADDGVHGYELWKLAPLPGDTNYDGRVDLTDFGLLKANFGRTGDNLPGELDYDGDVDLDDFGILKANFGVVGHVVLHASDIPSAAEPSPPARIAAHDYALAALGLAYRAVDEGEPREELP